MADESGVSDPEKVQEHLRTVRTLSNELAGYLHSLSDDIWRDADRFGSGCDQWKIADVVTHLILDAVQQTLTVSSALKGNTSSPVGYRHQTPEERIQSVITMRSTLHEDLFPEFNTTCGQLNGLLASFKQTGYGTTGVWHPGGVMPVSELIEDRAVELAVHSWDIRYGMDSTVQISKSAVPLLKEWMKRRFQVGFQNADATSSPVRYRFQLDDTATESYDLLIGGGELTFGPSDDASADVTFRCDTNTYLLFAMGRLPFERSVRRGRLSFDGDEGLASRFVDRFRPL